MTLILKLDLDMVRMYLHTKNKVSMPSGSKVIVCTDGHTDRQTDTQTDMQTDRHDQKHYLPAYEGGKYYGVWSVSFACDSRVFQCGVRECVRTRVGALQLDGDLDGVLRPQQVEHRLQVVPDVSCNQSPDTDNTRHSRAFHFSF